MQKVKNSRDKNLKKNYYNKRAILESGLRIIYFFENPSDICGKLKLLLQEKRTGNNSNKINQENFAIFDKKKEYKCITPTQQRNYSKNLFLHKKCDYVR